MSGPGGSRTPSKADRTIRREYDEFDRVTKVDYGHGEYKTTAFSFDDANQLVSSTTDGVTTRYAYDAAGRHVREGSRTYTYGYLDKMMSVRFDRFAANSSTSQPFNSSTVYTYTYHPDGQLAIANYGDSSESFTWDDLALIQRGDEQFINEPHIGGGNPVVSSMGTSYFNDALGTTVGAKSGKQYSAAVLTAFGEDLTVNAAGDSSHSPFPVPPFPVLYRQTQGRRSRPRVPHAQLPRVSFKMADRGSARLSGWVERARVLQ